MTFIWDAMGAMFINAAIFMHDQSTIGAKAGRGGVACLATPTKNN